MSLRRRRPAQWLTLESSKAVAETIAITITRQVGAPTAAWRVLDGGQIYEYAGDALSHVVQVGPCKIECRVAPKWMATADLDATITHIDRLRKCSALTLLSAHFEAWDVAVSDLPANLQIASIYASSITGDLSEFPASITRLDLWYCAQITGSQISHMRGLDYVDVSNQSATQARVNAIILDIWQHRAAFTYSGAIACNLDGNNAAPSGNVTAPEEGSNWHLVGETWIPLTAGAMVFDLVNDVNSEGFNFWNITVS